MHVNAYARNGGFVAAILVDGKVLRERVSGGVAGVTVVRGVSFSLLLKNISSVNARATVTVEQSPLSMAPVLVMAGQSVTVDRWNQDAGGVQPTMVFADDGPETDCPGTLRVSWSACATGGLPPLSRPPQREMRYDAVTRRDRSLGHFVGDAGHTLCVTSCSASVPSTGYGTARIVAGGQAPAVPFVQGFFSDGERLSDDCVFAVSFGEASGTGRPRCTSCDSVVRSVDRFCFCCGAKLL